MTDTDKLYKIKPLEWEYGEFMYSWMAVAPGYEYEMEYYEVKQHSWYRSFRDDEKESPCASIEEGKAAAEAHWRERILPMLEEVE